MDTQQRSRNVGIAVFFIISSAIGLVAALVLLVEKIHLLENPGSKASCDFGLIVQCGKNLASWQGSLLGFPNPTLGLIAWPVVMATGVAMLAGAQFAKWYWRSFNIVALGALAFAIWLVYQSVFVLGTLCPWCLVTWSAVIPLFWVTTLWNIKNGVWTSQERAREIGSRLLGWAPTIVFASYLLVAIVAQIQLDVLSYL
jgi:uncharacterized membrane protein